MLSKKYFFGVVQRFTSAESVQQFSWKHGLALGIMNASERTVKYIGRITSPIPMDWHNQSKSYSGIRLVPSTKPPRCDPVQPAEPPPSSPTQNTGSSI